MLNWPKSALISSAGGSRVSNKAEHAAVANDAELWADDYIQKVGQGLELRAKIAPLYVE